MKHTPTDSARRAPASGATSSARFASISSPPWASRAAWAAVALFGVALLYVALALHPVGDYYTESDFYGGYATGARAIQHGVVTPSRYPVVGPGYEFVLALIGLGGLDLFLAGKLLSVACATATLALWFVLLRVRTGSVVALVVTVLFAANPVFVRYAYSATTDLFGTFLASASMFALLGPWRGTPGESSGRPGGARALLAAGVMAGCAALTRYNLGALVPAALVTLAWLEPDRTLSRRRAIAFYLAGFGVVVLPWTLYSMVAGAIPAHDLYENFGFYLNPDPSRNVQDEYGFLANASLQTDSLLDLLRTRPLEVLRHALVNVPQHLARDAFELLGAPIAALCALGAAVAVRSPWRRALAPVVLHGALLFAALVPVFYSDRYSLPLIPAYLSVAALLATTGAMPWRVPAGLRALVFGAACVWLVAWCVPYQRKVLSRAPIETREAGRVLASIASPGQRIVSRKGHVGYYSDLTAVPFPRFKTLGELAAFARDRRADYLYFSWYEALLRQEFAYLLDTTATVPGLTVLHVTTRNPGVAYRIGPEFGRDPGWNAHDAQRRLHLARGLVQVLPDSLAATHRLVIAAHALEQGRLADALRDAELASRGRPDDAFAWMLQGEALRQMSRPAQARVAFERALALDAQDDLARIGLGFAELATGDSTRAAATWRTVVSRTTDPGVLAEMRRLFERVSDSTSAAAAAHRLRDTAGTR